MNRQLAIIEPLEPRQVFSAATDAHLAHLAHQAHVAHVAHLNHVKHVRHVNHLKQELARAAQLQASQANAATASLVWTNDEALGPSLSLTNGNSSILTGQSSPGSMDLPQLNGTSSDMRPINLISP